MNRRDVLVGGAAILVGASWLSRAARADDAVNVSKDAQALYRRSLVFDANCAPDTDDKMPQPKALLDEARGSGITGIKTSLGGFAGTFEDTLAELAFYQRLIETHPDTFMQVRRHADFAVAKRERKLGILFSFETVTPLAGKVERIELFRNLGVRVMQLTYNLQTPFGTGCLGDANAGLTDLGKKAIEAMSTHRVALDLSHSNVKTSLDALDVLRAVKRSAIITHAGCAAVHPHPRNKPDDLLRAIAREGGVVGIYDLPYLAASPKQPTLDDYIAHLSHALDVCGEDHVGIGSDSAVGPWDTSPAALAAFAKNEEDRHKAGVAAPEEDRPLYVVGLNTSRRCEVIADALLKRGYKARAVEKVLGLNFTEALRRIWEG